jgi:hypothetical protein
MAKINTGRVVVGGLVAGVIIFLAEGITNGAILGQQWKEWGQRMGSALSAPAPGTAMGFWALISFVLGIIGVWIYAAVRPRFGAGPATAIKVGFLVWMIYWVLVALEQTALGTVPPHLLVVGSIGGLIGVICGLLAGAALYKEEAVA